MALRIAINGYGRIGRNVLRAWFENGADPTLAFVAVNDLGKPEALAHLTRYDSTHGRFAGEVCLEDGDLVIGGHRLRVFNEADPERLPWDALDVDVVLECTGQFRARAEAARHLAAGAGKVVIGAAPFDEVDATLVYGVNHAALQDSDRVLSSVSCTTHALVPLVKILDEAFGIDHRQVYMGVLIQVGVNATAAGVLVTKDLLDPTDEDGFTINAKWGLGERVVQGQKSPEQVIFDPTNDGTKIITRSDDPIRLVFDENGGTKEIPVDPGAGVILTEERAKKLCTMVGKFIPVFTHGHPLDVEWVLEGEDFWIVQARPYVGS